MSKFVVALVGCLSVGSAFAQVLAFDNFDYMDGSLVGNGAWVSHSGTAGDLLVSGGMAVVTHGTPSEDVSLPFTSTMADVYYAFDFSVDALMPGAGTDHEYFAHFKNSTTGFSARLDVQIAPSSPPARGGDFVLGIATVGGASDNTWGSPLNFATTYRVVVRYNSTVNVAELWVDPASVASPSVLSAVLGGPGNAALLFALRQSDSSNNETIRVDSLVIGETFDDVLVAAPVELQSFSIE